MTRRRRPRRREARPETPPGIDFDNPLVAAQLLQQLANYNATVAGMALMLGSVAPDLRNAPSLPDSAGELAQSIEDAAAAAEELNRALVITCAFATDLQADDEETEP